MRDSRVEVVETGQPPVQLLACALCGVLLWDIRAHYRHAHLGVAPVLPSSGVDEDACWHEANCRCVRAGNVDEDKLAEVLRFHRFTVLGQCACGYALSTYGRRSHDPEEFDRHYARAVAEWLKGQG